MIKRYECRRDMNRNAEFCVASDGAVEFRIHGCEFVYVGSYSELMTLILAGDASLAAEALADALYMLVQEDSAYVERFISSMLAKLRAYIEQDVESIVEKIVKAGRKAIEARDKEKAEARLRAKIREVLRDNIGILRVYSMLTDGKQPIQRLVELVSARDAKVGEVVKRMLEAE